MRELEKLRKDIDAEEKKLKQFDEWLKNRERAEQMRRFIILYATKSESWPADKQQEHREWIEWASREADRLDPFVLKKPFSVVDRKRELGRQW